MSGRNDDVGLRISGDHLRRTHPGEEVIDLRFQVFAARMLVEACDGFACTGVDA